MPRSNKHAPGVWRREGAAMSSDFVHLYARSVQTLQESTCHCHNDWLHCSAWNHTWTFTKGMCWRSQALWPKAVSKTQTHIVAAVGITKLQHKTTSCHHWHQHMLRYAMRMLLRTVHVVGLVGIARGCRHGTCSDSASLSCLACKMSLGNIPASEAE